MMAMEDLAQLGVDVLAHTQAMQTSLDRYRDDHVELGGFLTAVLQNDLLDAVSRADRLSLLGIKAIVQYCHWELPSGSWGSSAAVKAWLAARPT